MIYSYLYYCNITWTSAYKTNLQHVETQMSSKKWAYRILNKLNRVLMLTQTPYDNDLFEILKCWNPFGTIRRIFVFLQSFSVEVQWLISLRTRNTRNAPSICILRYYTELWVCYQGPSGSLIRLMLSTTAWQLLLLLQK